MNTQKNVFWQALIVALIMFNLGVFMGYMLEKNRINKIDTLYAESELQFLDIRALADISYLKNVNCSFAVKENIKFADKIYEEAKILQRYEDASRISDALILRHKKYDLLRTQVWINSIRLKEMCAVDYKNVVYLYEYSKDISIELKAKQDIFSRKLVEVKEKLGWKMLLLPVAGNNNLSSIDLLKIQYNITELPAILIDEKAKIVMIEEVGQIESYLN